MSSLPRRGRVREGENAQRHSRGYKTSPLLTSPRLGEEYLRELKRVKRDAGSIVPLEGETVHPLLV